MTSPLLQRASTTEVATSSTSVTPPRKRSTSLLVDYSKLSSCNSKLASTIGNTSLRSVALSTRNLTLTANAAAASRRPSETEKEVTATSNRRQSSERENREKLILQVLDQAAELSVVATAAETSPQGETDQASSIDDKRTSVRSISFKMKRRSSITTSSHESSSSFYNHKLEMEDSSGGKSTSSRSAEDCPQEATLDGRRSYHSLLDSTSTHSVFAPKRRDSSKRLLVRSKSGSRMESRRSLLLSASYHPPTTTNSSMTLSACTRSAPSSPTRTRSNRNLLKATSNQEEEEKSTQHPTSNTTDPSSSSSSSSSSAPQDATATKSRGERRKEKLLLKQTEGEATKPTARGVLPRRSKSTSNDVLATNTAPMRRAAASGAASGKIDRRGMMMRQKSLRDLKKSKEQVKRRPSLSRQGSFTTKQSEFAALEALVGKTTTRPNTITITTTKNNKKQTIRKCKSLDTGGFVTTLPSSNDSAVVEVGERRPVALTSPNKLVTTSTTSPTRPTTTRTLAPVTMPSRVGDRRRMMMLQQKRNTQSLRHLSYNNNNKRDQLNTTSEHHHHRSMTTTTKKCPPLRSHSFGNNSKTSPSDAGGSRRGLMLRQGSFVAGSRMRTLRG